MGINILTDFMSNGMDNSIAKWFFRLSVDAPFLDDFFITMSALGNGGIIFFIIIFLCLFNKKTRFFSFLFLISLGLTFLVNDLMLKHLFLRPRPFLNPELTSYVYKDVQFTYLAWEQSGYSFPSGHSASSFSIFGALLMYTIMNKFENRKTILPFTITMGVIASLIAISRLYLRHHYFTDILTGSLVGLAMGIGAYFVTYYLLRFLKNKFQKQE